MAKAVFRVGGAVTAPGQCGYAAASSRTSVPSRRSAAEWPHLAVLHQTSVFGIVGAPIDDDQTMLGHLGINVPDLRAAKAYYAIAMPLLGFEEFLSAEDQFAYRPRGGKPGTYVFFYPSTEASTYSRHCTGLQHLAFMMPTRGDVDRLLEIVTELSGQFGGRVLHAPRHFPEYPPPYYAMFWLDPWGFMIEAVCHHDAP